MATIKPNRPAGHKPGSKRPAWRKAMAPLSASYARTQAGLHMHTLRRLLAKLRRPQPILIELYNEQPWDYVTPTAGSFTNGQAKTWQ